MNAPVARRETSRDTAGLPPFTGRVSVERNGHRRSGTTEIGVVPVEGLRALFAFDAVPAGCIVVPVTEDDLAPHLRPGEFAIVDTEDREPISGELFLVAWMVGLDRDGRERTALCQAEWRPSASPDGRDQSAWRVGSLRRRRTPEERERLVEAGRYDELGWSNGPYKPGMLEQQVRGRVVGILAPTFEEPKRLPAGNGDAV